MPSCNLVFECWGHNEWKVHKELYLDKVQSFICNKADSMLSKTCSVKGHDKFNGKLLTFTVGSEMTCLRVDIKQYIQS